MADSAQPLGHPWHRFSAGSPKDNDDLIASIDRTSEKLADCRSIAESALAIIQGRSPPKANPVRERLAKAKARISGEAFTISFLFLLHFAIKISDHYLLESCRFNCLVGESSISGGSRGGVCQCQGHCSDGSPT